MGGGIDPRQHNTISRGSFTQCGWTKFWGNGKRRETDVNAVAAAMHPALLIFSEGFIVDASGAGLDHCDFLWGKYYVE